MSDTNQDKTARTPRLTIDQNATLAGESADTKPEAGEQHDSAANDFDEAMGLIKGTGAAIWSYARVHMVTMELLGYIPRYAASYGLGGRVAPLGVLGRL